MIPRSPDMDDLVRRLLLHEAGGARDAVSLDAAVERVCRKLSGELEALVGRDGAAALLGRAASLAARELPFLAPLRQAGSPPTLMDLRESLRGLAPTEADAASVALLANLMGLLVNLLGEDLGLLPVGNVWPNVLPGAGPPASTETRE